MLMYVSPERVLGRFMPTPLPPADTFAGQTVLVTGGTTGLGHAAALHFARLGASVIITCRQKARGETARQHIEDTARVAGQKGMVTALELNMSHYASCVDFAETLKRSLVDKNGGLDVAVLSAGSINPQFTESPEGWEETIQVNALSTTLLGLLLLDWMKQQRAHRTSPAHLVFVTSRDHLYPDISHWAEWSRHEGLLRHLSRKEDWPAWWATTEPNYASSKLLVMYAIDRISEMAKGPEGDPQVIVNSVCPGLVHTDIGRAIAGQSWLMKWVVTLYMTLGGKPPDYGARFIVKSACRPKEEHGAFSNGWLSPERYRMYAASNMTSAEAKEVGDLAWKEIVEELTSKVRNTGLSDAV